MSQTITSIGQRAAATLKSCSELVVVAIFERSCYLRHGDAFVCIGDASIGDGPLNALVAGLDHVRQRLRLNSVVQSAGNLVLLSDGTHLNWKDTAVWVMPSWPAIGDFSPLTPANLQSLLAASPTVGLFRPAISTLLGTELPAATLSEGRLERLMAALAQGLVAAQPRRDAHLKAAVRDLIGLGPGLTPSGDDVLAGALLGLHATGHLALAAELGNHVASACIHGTSPLSAAFLRCAIDGGTSADLHHVFSAALANTARTNSARTNSEWSSALDTLDRIGHTSGWDHLAGFLLALTAVQSRPRS
jgi:Protein of unknown function (DUF2877)